MVPSCDWCRRALVPPCLVPNARVGCYRRTFAHRLLVRVLGVACVALRAVVDGFLGIIKTPRAMSGNPAEQVGVVMILAPQKLLVVVQLARDMHLMAGRAELG